MSNPLESTLAREKAKLQRQKDAVAATEALIEMIEKQLASASKSR